MKIAGVLGSTCIAYQFWERCAQNIADSADTKSRFIFNMIVDVSFLDIAFSYHSNPFTECPCSYNICIVLYRHHQGQRLTFVCGALNEFILCSPDPLTGRRGIHHVPDKWNSRMHPLPKFELAGHMHLQGGVEIWTIKLQPIWNGALFSSTRDISLPPHEIYP